MNSSIHWNTVLLMTVTVYVYQNLPKTPGAKNKYTPLLFEISIALSQYTYRQL